MHYSSRKDFIKKTLFGAAALSIGSTVNNGVSVFRNERSIDDVDFDAIDPGSYDNTWWNRAPVRLIQTNLREIDAMMDVEAYVQSILDGSANVVLLNVGGIVANYPTQLPYHYRNPFMKGDLVGTLVDRLHQHDVKVIGRFDFSKLNEVLAEKKPEWLYVGTHGKNVNYNGQVHTCINGGYQQEYLFHILKEAIIQYPLDGIFFNMIGYTTTDYNDESHGICQCENCKNRFFNATGAQLPVVEDIDDPVFREYNAFKSATSDELFNRIGKFIKELNPNLVVNTYTDAGVDMIRMESSSHIRNQHEWNYFSTDHVKRVLGSYDDRAPSNLLQYFLALGYRHVAAAPSLSKVWVLQNMLQGGALDVYVIGTLVNQADRAFIAITNDLYAFHKKHEKLFTNLAPRSKVALVRGNGEEYKGMIRLLSEEHILFDIIEPSAIGSDHIPRNIDSYDALILGDVSMMGDELIGHIDSYVQQGGKVLATGFTATRDKTGNPMANIRLKSLGVKPGYELVPRAKSTYLSISTTDKDVLGDSAFRDIDLMMVYADFLKCVPTDQAKGYFRLVPSTMFGPPEKCYFMAEEITDIPGMIVNEYGKGHTVFVPWPIGAQYNFKGHHAHRALFATVLNDVLKIEKTIETDASPLIEISHMVNRKGAYEWIGLINHAGQLGATFRDPVSIHQITLRFKPVDNMNIKAIRMLRAERHIDFKEVDGWVECEVPRLDDFEVVLCLYDGH
ncbi:alpha-amylase family protein [Parapedobacter koreensis]|uniref:Hypothetical glycosyl hydrolase 6 n=1 Tax=Parapedobacter koreensis TaxID=332977 RepID=A0A1H7UIG4_9SPHI|nr:alpha-amylase family protein [Parapedobacter koreensis]SEL96823.1 Hypothetical glycosyl hydrolase 6 [Parapedobacter koreensis]